MEPNSLEWINFSQVIGDTKTVPVTPAVKDILNFQRALNQNHASDSSEATPVQQLRAEGETSSRLAEKQLDAEQWLTMKKLING
jgi:hypothetical protein